MSKKDELTIILWLNSSPDDNDNGAGSHKDGIFIYDDYSAGKLFTQGVSVYPAVHPDFLSKVMKNQSNRLYFNCSITKNVFLVR